MRETSGMSSKVCAVMCFWVSLGCLLAQTALDEREDQRDYRLGPQDEIAIYVLDFDELSKDLRYRIESNGTINVPIVGRIHAAGLTVHRIEEELCARLRAVLLNPQVTVSILQYRSQPVSLIGAVNTSGVHQIEGGKTLYEVLSLAGGLRPDAGSTIKITRRKEYGPIPLPSAAPDVSGNFIVAEVSVASVTKALNPKENILVQPYDVISVPSAEVVYVVGAVRKPGGFTLGDKAGMSVLQVLAMAEGLEHGSAPSKARVIKRSEGSSTVQTEVSVNLKGILEGKLPDVPLLPNDILFIPNASGAKGVALRAADIAAAAGAMAVVYHY